MICILLIVAEFDINRQFHPQHAVIDITVYTCSPL